jgi:hypothetical protein
MSTKELDIKSLHLPEALSGLFHRYHNRILVDDSLADVDVVMLSIYLVEDRKKRTGVTYDECRQVFLFLGRKAANYPANIYLGKKKSLIEQDGTLLFLTIGGLKKIRMILGQVEKVPVHVIRSGQSFTAIKLLEQFLSQEISSEEVLLCDSYISAETLYPFSALKGKTTTLRILASTVQDEDRFRGYRVKFSKETGMSAQVRISTKIHDRYLISGEKCWSFGASIKDLGNKDTTIKEISEVTESMKQVFAERWNESPGFA